MLSSSFIKRCYSTKLMNSAIHSVTIVGGGQMGAGIAQVAAQTGHIVVLVDQSEDVLTNSMKQIKNSVGKIAKRKFPEDVAKAEKMTRNICKTIKTTTDLEESVQECDLVIEAIVEDLDIKRNLIKDLDKFAPYTTIFASNTSTYLIKSLADITERHDRFAGLHFFNPVPIMKLLEIVSTEKLSPEVRLVLNDFGNRLGKKCINCKDTPGFVVNRLLIPYTYQALFMYERGDASIEDIDTAMKLGAGYPMGPFELMDYVGLDTMYYGMQGWVRDYPEVKTFSTSKLLEKMVKEGKLGIKTGEGFRKHKK